MNIAGACEGAESARLRILVQGKHAQDALFNQPLFAQVLTLSVQYVSVSGAEVDGLLLASHVGSSCVGLAAR